MQLAWFRDVGLGNHDSVIPLGNVMASGLSLSFVGAVIPPVSSKTLSIEV